MAGSDTAGGFRVRDMLSRSISITYGNSKDFLVMAAVIGLPQFVAMILTVFMEPDFEKAMKDPKQGILGLIIWLLLIATGVLLVKYLGALPALAANKEAGRRLEWTESLAWARDQNLFWGVLGTVLLMLLAVLGGLILLIVPGVIVGVWFMLALPARVLGGHGAVESLRVSRGLVRPVFRKALGLGAVLVGVMFLPSLIVEIVSWIAWGFASRAPAHFILSGVVTYLAVILWSPVAGVGITLLYLDRTGGIENVRREVFLP